MTKSTGLNEQIDIYNTHIGQFEKYFLKIWKWAVFDEKSKFAEFSRVTAIFYRKTDNGFVLRAQNV
jgi:hypothetical protein